MVRLRKGGGVDGRKSARFSIGLAPTFRRATWPPKSNVLFNVRSIFPVAWQFSTSHLQFALTSGIALRLTSQAGRGSERKRPDGRPLQLLGLSQIEESHSNETSTNLLGVGSAHLCRDRLGTGHKKRKSRTLHQP